ncbi:uncharacterized protein K489DRAFT_269675 [Dissoconium aciculare CBS 342.82]|uniref:Apple domain-containing protein n=1 Tax=Dissoconium aciculare CBS 342.82 TaxID=1314786 RepID=A0A6J3LZY0_9PEZI|nr:uncharacterized protein K489DRAFT_269675 [Dissoconium aciculare CBS 342.82]KAF1821228.1 hypothetical protein K489DRAFT_269675 [Dissoconium aciculare CBS 342.82]
MLVTIFFVAWASAALADSVTSQTVCTTKYGRSSINRVSTVYTRNPTTTVFRVYQTSTSTRTITPAPVTTTTTVTSTSTRIVNTQSTDIATATSTSTQVDTAVTTTTSTSTVTTVTTSTSASTTTVPTAAGFTAVALQGDYVAKRTPVARLEGQGRRERDAQLELEAREAQAAIERRASAKTRMLMPAATATTAPSQYPSAVTCGVSTSWYITFTSTTSTTTTIAPVTATATSTASTSVDSTSTLAPTTITTTTTASATTTTTTTVSTSTTTTSTRTAVVPQSTYYAQCGSNNLVNHVHGGIPVAILSYSSAFSLESQPMNDSTGYGCCALCASMDNCAGFGQHPSGTCYYILTQGQCDGSQTYGDAYHYYGSTTSPYFYTVGNGACGRLGAVSGPVASA